MKRKKREVFKEQVKKITSHSQNRQQETEIIRNQSFQILIKEMTGKRKQCILLYLFFVFI